MFAVLSVYKAVLTLFSITTFWEMKISLTHNVMPTHLPM